MFLRELPLYYQNNLKSFPKFEVSQLLDYKLYEFIDLGQNGLAKTPQFISKLPSMKSLNLSSNKFWKFPSGLLEMANLEEIDLGYNLLHKVTDQIELLTNLKVLYLNNNHLKQLPNSFGNLNLEALFMGANEWLEIPKSIFQLKHLRRLDLSNSNLTVIPSGFRNLKSLTKLDLSNNSLVDFSYISELQNLKELYLCENNLEKFPSEILTLGNLEVLRLDKNNLTEIPMEIFKLRNLKFISLNYNKLQAIPEQIGKLNKLVDLFIAYNKISELPAEISQLNNLKSLHIIDNPLEDPPLEIAMNGAEAVQIYLQSNRIPINEAKIILVGDGGSGKTSIRKLIMGQKFNPNEPQTHGINIDKWKIKDIDVTAHFWDFGGQEIMHSTHQFFLSKRSFYILVVDSRKDSKIDYWLKHIESFGGNSPILIVINKCDENPGYDLERKSLKNKYKNIKDIIKTSCFDGTGIIELRKKLKKEVMFVELLKTRWPKRWFKVKSYLEEMTKSDISYNEYVELCCSHKITKEEHRQILLRFLNDLGIVIYYQDLALRDVYVLNPRWVTEAIYKILNAKELASRKGEFDVGFLGRILDLDTYPRNKHNFIVELMKKFELCFSLRSNTLLIPELLEPEIPYLFDHKKSLSIRFQYDFLPKSVLPRFIVRMHQQIEEDFVWRTGVILYSIDDNSRSIDNGCRALVKADNDSNSIDVWITGYNVKNFFNVIRYTIKDICKEFTNMVQHEKVPLPEGLGFIDYEELLGLDDMGVKQYPLGRFRKWVNVGALLNGYRDADTATNRYEELQYAPNIVVAENVTNIRSQNFMFGESFQVGDGKMEKISVNIGDGNVFNGSVQIADIINQSYNKVQSSDVNKNLQTNLIELTNLVSKLCEELKADDSENAARDLDAFISETTSANPRRKWYELSGEGLIKAASTCSALVEPITKLVNNVMSILR